MMKSGGPGWNDPPQLSHQIHSETKSRRNLLNKRVAYLGYSPDSNAEAENYSLLQQPPTDKVVVKDVSKSVVDQTPPSQLNIFVPSAIEDDSGLIKADELVNTEKSVCDEKEQCDDTSKKQSCIEHIEDFSSIIPSLLSLADQCLTDKNKMAVNDIKKKLAILKDMADNDALSEPVSSGMLTLTSHLVNKQYDAAWEKHVTLMCDHVSEVRLWMVGVKRLIGELRKSAA